MKRTAYVILVLLLAGTVGAALGEDTLRGPLERRRELVPTRVRRAPLGAALRNRDRDEPADWKLDERPSGKHGGDGGRGGGRGGGQDKDDSEDE